MRTRSSTFYMIATNYLAEEGVRPAVEVPLLRARLAARGLGEGVQHLVRVDQVLVVDRRGKLAAGAGLLYNGASINDSR